MGMLLNIICTKRNKRCFDLSGPVQFKLSDTSLEVTSWHGWRTRRWPVSDVEAVNVYKQVDTYGHCPCKPLTRGLPEPVQEEDNIDLFETCPATFCLNTNTTCTSVFLGAKISNELTIVPLSRYCWHPEGLACLFRIDKDVQLFLADRLPVSWQRFCAPLLLGQNHFNVAAPILKPSERAIAKLPIQAWDGTEIENCAVCCINFVHGDLTRKLHCAHAFHVDCIDQWLRQNWNCPTCRRPIRQAPNVAKASNACSQTTAMSEIPI